MIVVLGDIHFRADHPYFLNVCESFLNWFNNWDKNNKDNELILAGDLVESAVLSGKVVDYLERFSQYSKFKTTHVVVGNHDRKIIKHIPQLAYEFFRQKPTFKVYDTLTEITIEGKSALMMPYYSGINELNLSMADYYSNLYKNGKKYDFLVGHFSDEDCSFPGAIDCINNLDKLADKVIMGHIHTRNICPEKYIGSVFAGKKSENDNTRSAFIYDNFWKEEKIPTFNEFLEVSYPNDLPESNALVPIYTILNCKSESIAKSKYGNIYIRKVVPQKEEIKSTGKTELDRQFSDIKNLKIGDLFKTFIKSQKKPIDRIVVSKCSKALEMVN